MGNYLSKPVCTKDSQNGETEALRFAASSMQGWRISMEDAHLVVTDVVHSNGFGPFTLFGVFDGHGGPHVARFAAKHFLEELTAGQSWKEGRLEEALRSAYFQIDQLLMREDYQNELQLLSRFATVPSFGTALAEESDELSSLKLVDYDEESDSEDSEENSPRGRFTSDLQRNERLGSGSSSSDYVDATAEKEGDSAVIPQKLLVQKGTILSPRGKERGVGVGEGGDQDGGVTGGGLTSGIGSNMDFFPPSNSRGRGGGVVRMFRPAARRTKGDKKEKREEKTKEGKERGISNATVENCPVGGVTENSLHPPSEKKDLKLSNLAKLPRRKHKSSVSVQQTADSPIVEREAKDDLLTAPSPSHQLGSAVPIPGETSPTGGGGLWGSLVGLKNTLGSFISAGRQQIWSPLGFRGTPQLNSLALFAGCTALTVVIMDRKIIVANAGDSRCVLCRGTTAVQLSSDHKPQLGEEKRRIYAAGGYVELGRVNGNLNLSRAFGDHMYKQDASLPPEKQIVTANPDIHIIDISSEDEFLVLGCDGIWERLDSSQFVVDFVRARLSGARNLSDILEELFEELLSPNPAIYEFGCDNMSALLVDLKPHTRRRSTSKIEPKEPKLMMNLRTKEEGGASADNVGGRPAAEEEEECLFSPTSFVPVPSPKLPVRNPPMDRVGAIRLPKNLSPSARGRGPLPNGHDYLVENAPSRAGE